VTRLALTGLPALLLLAAAAAARGPVEDVDTSTARYGSSHVTVHTKLGSFTIELFPDKAPQTVQNFLGYVDERFYEGTLFHRVMGKENTANQKDFMIQGGGYLSGLKEKKTREPIKYESANPLSNLRGTVAMARTANPDSATSQFFINLTDNLYLDDAPGRVGYRVFGKVVDGMPVVERVKAVKTGNQGMFQNVPVEDVIIQSVRRAR